LQEAQLFFDQASEKTKTYNIAPVEISLVKGRRRRIVSSRHFGPVKALETIEIERIEQFYFIELQRSESNLQTGLFLCQRPFQLKIRQHCPKGI
jgi:hypothetical protein